MKTTTTTAAAAILATVITGCSGLHPVGSRITAPETGERVSLAYSPLRADCAHVGGVAAHRRGNTNPTEVVQALYEQAAKLDGDTFVITRDDRAGWGSTTYAEVYRCPWNTRGEEVEDTENSASPRGN